MTDVAERIAVPAARTAPRSIPRWVSPAVGIGALAFSAAVIIDGLWVLGRTAEQGVYSKLLAIHPAVATMAYVAFGVTAVASLLYLWPRTRRREWDHLAGASAEVGVVFCGLTLITGSIWGRPVWGVWWTWDARLTSTALLMALFVGYLALRRVPADEVVRARRCAVAALIAILDVPVDHFATTWWQTLHQGSSIDVLQPDKHIDTAHNVALLLGFVAMTLTYAWLLIHRYRAEQLEARYEREGLEMALDARRAEGGV